MFSTVNMSHVAFTSSTSNLVDFQRNHKHQLNVTNLCGLFRKRASVARTCLGLQSSTRRDRRPSDVAFIVVRSLDPIFGFGEETLFVVNDNLYSLDGLSGPISENSTYWATRKITSARQVVGSVLAFLLGIIWWPLSIIAAAAFSTFTVVAAVAIFIAVGVFGFVFWALGEMENRIDKLIRFPPQKH